MSRVDIAGPQHVAAVYRESYALWGGGLSYEGYLGLWTELRATPWGREHLTFWVLLADDGTVRSSLKRYRTGFRIDGGVVPGCVIGAVFTPVRQRRKGAASRLLASVLERSAADGDRVALLFSDVGTSFYERFGFRVLDAHDALGRLRRTVPSAPAGRLRIEPMGPDHRAEVAAARDASCSRARFAIERDRGLWEFLRTRSRGFFDRYSGGDVRHRCSVALDAGRFRGYVIAVEGRGEWSVREVGAVDGTADTEADILNAAARDPVRRGARRVHGWLPEPVTARLPEWNWVHAPRRRAMPMLAALDPAIDLSGARERGSAMLSFLDQF